MPEAGHFVIGLSIIVPIIYLTDGKFSKKVAIIFLLNNWLGPDLGQIYSKLFRLEDITGLDFHWFLPFMLWAIPLAYFYSYFSRFSVQKGDKFLSINDDGFREISWRDAYLLCISGGLLHTIADAIFRKQVYNSTIKILDDFIQPDIGDLFGFATYGLDIGVAHVLFTYFIAIFVVFYGLYILDKDFKKVLRFYSIYIALVFSITLFFVGDEYDSAVIILSVFFIVVPLMLLFYVEKEVKRNKDKEKQENKEENKKQKKNNEQNKKHRKLAESKPKIEAEMGIKTVGTILSLFSVGLMVFGILLIKDPLLFNDLEEIRTSLVITLAIIIIITAAIMFIGGFGLFFKKPASRYIAMGSLLLLFILIYPMVMFFYLCQDNVKSKFMEKGEQDKRELNN